MTQQQAIHAVLTHSRNEIIQSQTNPTRITYRTPNTSHGRADAVIVYEGTLPGPASSTPGLSQGRNPDGDRHPSPHPEEAAHRVAWLNGSLETVLADLRAARAELRQARAALVEVTAERDRLQVKRRMNRRRDKGRTTRHERSVADADPT